MSAAAILAATLQRARRRRLADAAFLALPPAIAAVAIAWRSGGPDAGAVSVLLATIAVGAWARHAARTVDARWLARRLDAARPDMEDSAALLFASQDTLAPLQRLQQERLRARIAASPMPELRPRWSTRPLLAGVALAGVVVATCLLWPRSEPLTVANVLARIADGATRASDTRIVAQELAIVPPGYTGRPSSRESALDARAPERSALRWTLRFAPQPRTAHLAFHDGRRVALSRRGDDWHAEHVLLRPALYRIEVGDAPALKPPRRHRLDVVADRPPQVRALSPDRSLSEVTPGQRTWSVAFEAQDDYGVAATARLRVILAQGSGENVTFREQAVTLRGTGVPTRRRYAHRLDFGALGFAPGDDLIVQLIVQDMRTPVPHRVRGPSLILRWVPAVASETSALDGMVRKVLPAYFRSQRQIIIDAEALLKQKGRLGGDAYLARSDGLGVDQRILRLRYGQFLGEETEGAPRLPTNDAEPPLPTSDTDHAGHDDAGHDDGRRDAADHSSETPQEQAVHAEDAPGRAGAAPEPTPRADASSAQAHDHRAGAPTTAPVFGQDAAVLEQFGHTHDHAEAATLLDPETRTTLKAALDQMWQSELHLRQGEPGRALPYAHRALGFIKQVQQASRIYLARVGPELPPIDAGRRLGGDRAGLSRRGDVLESGPEGDPVLARLWQSLDGTPGPRSGAATPVDTRALERWLQDNTARLPDPLAFAAALDAVRTDPTCIRCRRELRSVLWPLMPRPAAAVPRRDAAGATGARYLDALRGPEAP